MAKSIFDQNQPRSVLARRLDEAFAGCEKWTVAPPRERRLDGIPAPVQQQRPVQASTTRYL